MSFLGLVRNLWNTPPRHSIEHRETPKVKRRRYDGAKRGRNYGNWMTTGNSANADISQDLATLRNRSRDIIRNNDYARGAIQKYVDNVIFQGITFQSQVKQLKDQTKNDNRSNNLIETRFKEWAEQKLWCHTAGKLNFNEIQQLVFKSFMESGEVFVRKVKQSFSGSPIPFALEVIESDQLAENHNSSFGGNQIVMGIEINEWQRPVAYWFYKKHPGELFQGMGGVVSRELKRVPATEIIHLHITDRPNQLRGIPILFSTLLRIKNTGDYEENEQLAAKLTSCLMVGIETPYSDLLQEPKQYDPDNLPADEVWEPGISRYYAPGEKINLINPTRPNPNLVAFIEQQLRAMGAGIGLSYETVSNDYSKTNYSSSRLSLINARDRYKVLQAWFASNFLKDVIFGNPESDGWLDMAVLSGVLNFPDYELRKKRYCEVKWQFRGWAWIDPLKEVKARVESLVNNMGTMSDHYAEQGLDFEESMRAIAREREFAKSLGINLNFTMSSNNIEDDEDNQPKGNSGKESKQKAIAV